jgi:hypothetical protein
MLDIYKISRIWVFIAVVSVASSAFADEPYQGRIFDAHVHYSHQTWGVIDTEAALRLLDEVGITTVLTSSTPDEGTLKLMQKNTHVSMSCRSTDLIKSIKIVSVGSRIQID